MEQTPAPGDLEKFRPHVEAITHAIKGLRHPKRILMEVNMSGQTSAAGGLVLELFSVPAGETFSVHRVVLEAAGYTPGAPYSAGYAAILNVMTPPAVGAGYTPGSLRDFAPTPGGTQVFPQVSTDAELESVPYRENACVALYVSGGPASTLISVYLKGYRAQGEDGIA